MVKITLKIEQENLESHVKRICRSNLKKPAKICTQCPIIKPVMDIMQKYDWKYNPEILKYYKH